MTAMRKQQAASAAELERLRALAMQAGIALPAAATGAVIGSEPPVGGDPPVEGGGAARATRCDSGPAAGAADADATNSAAAAEDAAAQFGAHRISGLRTLDGVGTDDVKALEAAAMRAVAGDGAGCSGAADDGAEGNGEDAAALERTVGRYQSAVERAWADVQRLEDERQQVCFT